jgi:spermidine synthase
VTATPSRASGFLGPDSPARPQRTFTVVTVLFCLSGASSLIFETVFTRLLTYTFGNTAHAVSTVLAAFLGGLALGSYVLGKSRKGRSNSLRLYAALELLVGLYGLLVPVLFRATTQVYVGIYEHFHPGGTALGLARFALAALFVSLPAFLMGGTLPVQAGLVARSGFGSAAKVNALYAWNTLGAALGTLAATYALIPTLGVRGTIATACAANFAIAAGAMLLARSGTRQRHPEDPSAGGLVPAQSQALLLLFALLTGALALAYEVIWTHLQAFTIGSTVYSFGIMLFTVLCGLAAGAQLVARYLPRREQWPLAFAASHAALGVVVFVMLPAWGWLPMAFERGPKAILLAGVAGLIVMRLAWARLGPRVPTTGVVRRGWHQRVFAALLFAAIFSAGVALTRSQSAPFVFTELARFLCAFYMIFPPALLVGISFPLLLGLAAGARAEGVSANVGRVYAANTAGTILGSLAAGFLLLPRLGSQAALRSLATFNVALAVAAALALTRMTSRRRLAFATTAVLLVTIGWIGVPDWNPKRLLRGSYIYFAPAQLIDRVLFSREDVQGGITSVIQVGRTQTLLSNAKFQGNDAAEIGSQSRFGLVPALFTRRMDKALVIGLGTGHTLKTVALFPFNTIDVAELSPAIVHAARLWFTDVNGGVLDRDPRVRVHVTDGRNFLLLSPDSYDLITIEITSIWINGEADLYNREFYELCRRRLGPAGVLQQWVQLHHMRRQDLLTIFNTAGKVFPHLAFFVGPNQGLLVGSASPLGFDYDHLATLENRPGVGDELRQVGLPSLLSLLGEMELYDGSLRQALAYLPNHGQQYVSTDFHPYLEYQTPKGNVLAYDAFADNSAFLTQFRASGLPEDMSIMKLSSARRHLLLGYINERRGNLTIAMQEFARVEAPEHERAARELARLRTRTAAPAH